MSAVAQIPDGATVLIDTSPIIYLLEGNPLASRFEPLFADIEAGRLQALITPITLAEVLTGPIKAGNEALAERYRRALTSDSGWELREIDEDIAVLAARLRVQRRLKLPDAIQLAVALHEGCQALITHDRDFGQVDELLVLGPG